MTTKRSGQVIRPQAMTFMFLLFLVSFLCVSCVLVQFSFFLFSVYLLPLFWAHETDRPTRGRNEDV